MRERERILKKRSDGIDEICSRLDRFRCHDMSDLGSVNCNTVEIQIEKSGEVENLDPVPEPPLLFQADSSTLSATYAVGGRGRLRRISIKGHNA